MKLAQLTTFLRNFQFLFLILLTIAGTILLAPIIPLEIQRLFYTFSVIIRSCLLLALPLLVLPYIVCSFSALRKKGTLCMLTLLGFIGASNFCATLAAYPLGINFIPLLGTQGKIDIAPSSELVSFLNIDFNSPVSIEMVLIAGLAIGLVLNIKHLPGVEKVFNRYYAFSTFCFENLVIPALPFYIIGTLFKILYDSSFAQMFAVFGKMLLMIIVLQSAYIFLVFLLGSGGNLLKAIRSAQVSLPAGLLGFASMSSLITMPATLKAAEKNTQDTVLSKMWITTSVNSHVIGESLSLPLIALTILYCWNVPFPPFETYLKFSLYATLAQFTGVAVPGGSLIIILPFLKSAFGFDTEMIGVITALSIFADPFGTAQNVMGNSGAALIIKRIFTTLGFSAKASDEKDANSLIGLK